MKNFNFDVANGMTLNLENLFANVKVSVGQAGKTAVSIDGDEKLIEKIAVIQPASDQILIKGEENQGGVTIVTNAGSVSFGNINTGRRSFAGGRTIVSRRSIVATGDLVIVNGKIVSGGSDDITVIEGGKIPEITVTVPVGTNLDVYSVEKTEAVGLNGKLNASLSAQQSVTAQGVTRIKANCSGQSSIYATEAKGDIKASARGQSNITAIGEFEDVEADVSGQSQVMISGNCQDFNGEASGQSQVTLTGKAKGRVRKHASGMSRVMANN